MKATAEAAGEFEKNDAMDWQKKLINTLSVDLDESELASGILSSVMVPITLDRVGAPHILLTKRTMRVEKHRGEVSFPGGIREDSDANLLGTALRETQEEIGLRSEHIRVLGRIEPVRTLGEIWIYPWVGTFEQPYDFEINPDEVDHILYLPMERLLQEGLTDQEVQVGNLVLKQPGIAIGSEIVWGATARVLQLLRGHLVG